MRRPTLYTSDSSGSTVTFEHQQSVRGRRRGFRRVLIRALAVSALLHGVLFLAWRAGPPPPPGTGEPAGTSPSPTPPPESALRAVDIVRPGGESGEEDARPVAARMPEAEAPAVREPVPAPADRMALQTVAATGAPRLVLATSGQGASGSSRPGTGSPGEPGRISPPVPRSLLPEWNPPEQVRGKRVTVRVEVGRDGRPTGQVRLDPPTGSESFDRRLREIFTSMRYRPGTRAGQPVVAWAEITFEF